MRALLPLLLMACGGNETIAITPPTLEFGSVDFQQELPPAGHNVIELSLENTGKRPLSIAFSAFPDDRLTISALFASTSPPTLADLESGSTHVVQIGVSAYELGERDTQVEGTIQLAAAGEFFAIPFDYVPVRIIDGDSGL